MGKVDLLDNTVHQWEKTHQNVHFQPSFSLVMMNENKPLNSHEILLSYHNMRS